MDSLTTTITIKRPAEEIYRWLTDFSNHKQIMPNLVEAEVTSSGPIGVGTTYRYVTEVMGCRFPSTGEVTACEPNRLLGQKNHNGPAPVETIYQFQPDQNTTEIIVTMKSAIGSFPKAGGFVKQQLKKSLEEQNARLKQILER